MHAAALAATAADRALVCVRMLETLDDLRAMEQLYLSIWGGGVIDSDHLKALAHSGNYVAGAFRDGDLVGASVGFFATPLGEALHSDVTGVRRDAGSQGVGLALKLHQRAWALDLGLTQIRWTFDPLIARNAYFNVERLRAEVSGYHANFYGPMRDGVNEGQGSDRLLMSWPLTAPQVASARDPAGSSAALPSHVPALLADANGRPLHARVDPEAAVVAIGIPTDIEAVRRADPDRARSWRQALRATLGAEIEAGGRVLRFCPDRGYVVERRQV